MDRHRHALTTLVCIGLAPAAHAQSTERAAFVANNGNVEGSVTSYHFTPDGKPVFVQKLVLGASSTPGTNSYGISLSPNGRLLAVSHATSSSLFERVDIVKVNADATMTLVGSFDTPDSPLDLEWMTNEFIAVTTTSTSSANNYVLLWRVTETNGVFSFAQVDYDKTFGFTAYLTVSPDRRFVFTSESTTNSVRSFLLDTVAGKLNPVGVAFGSGYPLGQGVTPDGRFLYAGGGISGSGFEVSGYSIDPESGAIEWLATSPYLSPGENPKQVVVSPYGTHAYAAHGYDATIQAFALDPVLGDLGSTGEFFDVGPRGSLGEMQVLDNLLLVTDRDTSTDGIRGLLSFTIGEDGTLTANGPRIDSQGSTPNQLCVWSVRCPADLNYDGFVDAIDYDTFVRWFVNAQKPADFNRDGFVDAIDLDRFIQGFVGGC